MKKKLKIEFEQFVKVVEMFIAVILILGMIVFSIPLLMDVFQSLMDIMDGKTINVETMINEFLAKAVLIIIGLEFVKMAIHYSFVATIEVLMFAIARKIIVDHNIVAYELLLDVIAISILFIIRKKCRHTEEGDICEL